VHSMRMWIALFALSLAGTGVRAVEIDPGPLWNSGDAQGRCPQLCSRTGGQWNGQWRTTEPGRMSVCDCVASGPMILPAPANAGPVIRYEQTEFVANDIERGTAATFDRCAAQCLADARCVAFTHGSAGTCYTKSRVGTIAQSMFATSGFIAARGAPPPMPGYAAPQAPPALATPNACSVGGTAKCPGCPISCNPGEHPVCTPPFDGVTMFCQRDASCRCVPS